MRRMYSKPQLLEAVESESKLNGIKVFEDIKDKDGHARFIEGDISLNPLITDLTKTYGKWSLSGTHLMIVLAFDVPNAKVLGVGNELCEIVVPDWIKNKIYPLFATSYIEVKSFTLRADDWSTQNLSVNFIKNASNKLLFVVGSSLTLSANRHARLQFDLLIDNE